VHKEEISGRHKVQRTGILVRTGWWLPLSETFINNVGTVRNPKVEGIYLISMAHRKHLECGEKLGLQKNVDEALLVLRNLIATC
jgi:hypothetical protein